MKDFVSASAKSTSLPTVGSTTSAVNASGSPERGKLRPKGNTAAGDPTHQMKPARTHNKATSGAAYGVTAKMPKQTSPEAAFVQGNGKIIPPATNRSRPNFQAGTAE